MPVDKFGNEIRQRSTTVKSDEGISLNFANKTYIRLDGESDMVGNLNMALRKIENLGDPTNPKDATSKEYVDNTKGTGVIGEVKDETATIKGNLDFGERYRIKNLPVPIEEKDAVNREYVDNLTINHPFEFKNNQYRAKTDLYLQGNKIQGVGTPFNDGDVVTKGYVESVSAPLLKLEEGEYKTKGDIDMSKTYTICNILPPVKDEQITDKKYVDEKVNFNSAFSMKNGGYEAKGHLYLRRNKILGLREPEQPGEPTTKRYVDEIYNNLLKEYVDDDDNIIPGKNVDMEGNQVLGLPEPTKDEEPATKKYVDDLQTQHVDEKGNIKFGRNVNLDNKRIFAMKEPRKANEGANKKYVDDTITKRIQEEKDNFLPQDPATKNYVDEAIKGLAGGDVLVSKGGVFIKENGHYRATAPLDIDNQKMENVPDPVDEKDAVNKKYIDETFKELTLKQGLVRENGGFNLVDSYINMNFNRLRNLGLPQHNEDAVPKNYLDSEILTVMKRVQNQFKELNQLVSVCGSCYKYLKHGDYQFTFGGPILNGKLRDLDKFNGFLVPANGVLKHFVTFSSGLILDIPGVSLEEIINKNYKPITDLYGSKDSLIKMFTLMKIEENGKEEEELGGIYFRLSNVRIYGDKIKQYSATNTFKFIIAEKFKNKEENFICSVNRGDIINIRSEYEESEIDLEAKTHTTVLMNSYYKPTGELGEFNIKETFSLHLATLTFLFKEMSFPNVLDEIEIFD